MINFLKRAGALKLLAAVAITALAVGATTATAASLIGSAQIKNNSVQSKDVKNGTLKKADLAAGLTVAGAQGAQGPQGPQGPAGPKGVTGATGSAGPVGPVGPAGSTGASGLSGVEYVSADGPAGTGDATAKCPEGKFAIAGGGHAGAAGWIYSSSSVDGTSWSIFSDGGDVPSTGTAFVVCANLDSPPTGLEAVSAAKADSKR
jgi:hypothetical protein